MRLGAIAAITLVVALVPALALGAARSTTKLSATLVGKNEVPKGSPTGKGSATVTLSGKKVCWAYSGVSGIDKPLVSHIHKGKAGTAGPVLVPLGGAYKASGCTTAPAAVVKAIAANPVGYYVNIHTAKYPAGAIRGQLKAAGYKY